MTYSGHFGKKPKKSQKSQVLGGGVTDRLDFSVYMLAHIAFNSNLTLEKTQCFEFR